MTQFHDAYARHQQSRWLRPDAARWIRPDAARFLKAGTRVEDVFPTLAMKYSPNQPRVPAGSGVGSGRWTDGSGGSSLSRPMGNSKIDGSDLQTDDLFGIRPDDTESDRQRLAADDRPGLPSILRKKSRMAATASASTLARASGF